MTEMLKTWLCNILFAAVIGSAAYYLLPPGKMEKGLKTVISLCVLSAVLLPLASFEKNLLDVFESAAVFDSDMAEEYRRNIDLSMQSDFTAAAEAEIRASLKDSGTEDADIYIDTAIDDDGRIIIKKIELHINKTDSVSKEEISKKVQSITGLVPNIFVKGQGE